MPNVLYIESEEYSSSTILSPAGRERERSYSCEELKQEGVRALLSSPLVQRAQGEKKIIVPGRDRGTYQLRIASFSGPESFRSVFETLDEPVDEVVLYAHGMPMYLQGENSAITGWNIPLDATYDQVEMFRRRHPEEATGMVTVADFQHWNMKDRDLFQKHMNPGATGVLLCCYPFHHPNEKYSISFFSAGVELSRLLGIEMTGPKDLLEITRGIKTDFEAREIIRYHPTTDLSSSC